jgi:hypothetical protein
MSDKLRGTMCCKDVEIVSRVRKYDGVKYLQVEVIRPHA